MPRDVPFVLLGWTALPTWEIPQTHAPLAPEHPRGTQENQLPHTQNAREKFFQPFKESSESFPDRYAHPCPPFYPKNDTQKACELKLL